VDLCMCIFLVYVSVNEYVCVDRCGSVSMDRGA